MGEIRRVCPVCGSSYEPDPAYPTKQTCGRGCGSKLAQARRNGNDFWTPEQEVNLRKILDLYPPPVPIPWSEITQLLHKSRGQISAKALKLGIPLTKQRRLSDWAMRQCPNCGRGFAVDPKYLGKECCGQSCAAKWNLNQRGHPRGMTGKHHSDETKKLLSIRNIERFQRMTSEERSAYGQMRADAVRKPRGPRSVDTYTNARGGRRADLGGMYFRSSWEANYARYLNWLQGQGQIRKWGYEIKTFEFPVKRGNRSYTPDFCVVLKGQEYEWHEVKGWMDANSATKIRRFHKYFPDEVLQIIDADFYRSLVRSVAPLISGWESGREKLETVETPTCSVDDCSDPVVARNFCNRHYTRWRKFGDPLHPDQRFTANR